MIKSLTKVDEPAVKEFNETIRTWTAYCRVCKITINGSLSELKDHVKKCHGK